jgi:hypothetical protein
VLLSSSRHHGDDFGHNAHVLVVIRRQDDGAKAGLAGLRTTRVTPSSLRSAR